MKYCEQRGFGVYTGSSEKKIDSVLTALLTDDHLLTAMSQKAKFHSRPYATLDIAKEIGDTLLNPTVEKS